MATTKKKAKSLEITLYPSDQRPLRFNPRDWPRVAAASESKKGYKASICIRRNRYNDRYLCIWQNTLAGGQLYTSVYFADNATALINEVFVKRLSVPFPAYVQKVLHKLPPRSI